MLAGVLEAELTTKTLETNEAEAVPEEMPEDVELMPVGVVS
jgi:hypothetical protein